MVVVEVDSCFLDYLCFICDALRDLLLFVQFKNVTNTQGGVLLTVKLLRGFFSRFFELYKWYQIAQRITYIFVLI